MKTRVAVYDDNKGREEALKLLIELSDDLLLIGARENYNTVEADTTILPDVALMDIDMRGVKGIEGLKRIRKVFGSYTNAGEIINSSE